VRRWSTHQEAHSNQLTDPPQVNRSSVIYLEVNTGDVNELSGEIDKQECSLLI